MTKAPKIPGGGPGFLPQALLYFVLTGVRLWVRLLGPKHAKGIIFAGIGISTLAAIILQLAT